MCVRLVLVAASLEIRLLPQQIVQLMKKSSPPMSWKTVPTPCAKARGGGVDGAGGGGGVGSDIRALVYRFAVKSPVPVADGVGMHLLASDIPVRGDLLALILFIGGCFGILKAWSDQLIG